MKFVKGLAFPDADEFMIHEASDIGTYQVSHLIEALKYVTEFGCAVDGGSHVGTWSREMARHFARVLAFEPSPDTFECLQANLAADPRYANVEPHHAALGAAPGFVEMALAPEQAARKNTGARFVKVGGPIPVVTLDSLHLDQVGFIKLDVEGSEPWALDGAADTIRRCRPVILFENKWLWTRHFGLPKEAVADRLRGLGYKFLTQVSKDAIWAWRPK